MSCGIPSFYACVPPSMRTSEPVMWAPSSEASMAITEATDSGSPGPVGDMMRRISPPSMSSGNVIEDVMPLVTLPGRDGVDPQALLRVLDGQRLSQCRDAALRRGVRRHPWMTELRRGRCRVHDAAVRREEVGDRLTAHQERAGEVHPQDLVPEVERALMGVGGAQDAGDVGQHVEPAETVDRSPDAAGGCRLVTDVSRVSDRRPVRGGAAVGVFHRLGECVRRDVDRQYRRAFTYEARHRGSTDTRSGPGHDGGSPREALLRHRLRLEHVSVLASRRSGVARGGRLPSHRSRLSNGHSATGLFRVSQLAPAPQVAGDPVCFDTWRKHDPVP